MAGGASPKPASPKVKTSPERRVTATSPSLRPRKEAMKLPKYTSWLWLWPALKAQPNSVVARIYNLLERNEPAGVAKYFDHAYAPTIVSLSVEDVEIKSRRRGLIRSYEAKEKVPHLKAEIVLLRPDGAPPKGLKPSDSVKSPSGAVRKLTPRTLDVKAKALDAAMKEAEADAAKAKVRTSAKKLVLYLRVDGMGIATAKEVALFAPTNHAALKDADSKLTELMTALRLMGMHDAASKGPDVLNLCKLRLQ